MRESVGRSARLSNRATAEIRSEKIQGDRRRRFFRVVAKHAFPRKTAPHLSAFVKVPERTCYDWLSGKSDAPAGVLMALLGEIGRGEIT